MCKFSHMISVALTATFLTAGSLAAQTIQGVLPSDDGGAAGYQHSVERSRFVTGSTIEQLRPIEEYGFSKIVGRDGVFATNLRNGLVIATLNDGADKGAAPAPQQAAAEEYRLTPDKHNAMVMDYFIAAGIPRSQIGGIQATTFLSATSATKDAGAPKPKVDGYASVLQRVVGGKFPVAESVAWARLDNDGRSLTEWVYWPAIPAKTIAEANRLDEMTTGARKEEYLKRLPAGLRTGNVVIHHSGATDEAAYDSIATFDVLEVRGGAADEDAGNMSKKPTGMAIVRHFDAAGKERRLPSERLTLGESDAAAK